MKKFILTTCAIFLAACSGTPLPQNAAEYIAYSQSAAGKEAGAVEDMFTVNEPVAEVERYLQKKSRQCLNVTISPTESSSMRWNSSQESLGEGHAAFLMHMDDPEVNSKIKPSAGVIMLATEIKSISSSKTRVVIHYNRNDELSRAVSAIKSWSKIRHVTCPKWRSGNYEYH